MRKRIESSLKASLIFFSSFEQRIKNSAWRKCYLHFLLYFVFKSQLQFPQVAYLMWPATLLRQWAWHGTVACPFESTSKSYAHCG